MSTLHLILLAIVQGVTEFLPISSSAHLMLVPKIMGEADQGLMVDVGAHAGTLLAVVLVFWRETWQMTCGSIDFLRGRWKSVNAILTFHLLIATLPGAIAGFAIISYKDTLMRHLPLIIFSNFIWATALYFVDRIKPQEKTIAADLTWQKSLFVGLAQMIALIPGTSRSGITMTAGRYLGFTRLEAARLSFMMSIPITLGAVLAVLVELIKSHPDAAQIGQFALVAGLSFVTALATIWFLMKWLKRFNYTPFVVYRLLLAVGMVVWLYF